MSDEKDKPRTGPPPSLSSQPLGAPRQGLGGRQTPPEAPPATQVDPAIIAAATAAATIAIEKQRTAGLATPDMDKTIPGGIYIVEGQVVDAHGNPREMPGEEKARDEAEPATRKEP